MGNLRRSTLSAVLASTLCTAVLLLTLGPPLEAAAAGQAHQQTTTAAAAAQRTLKHTAFSHASDGSTPSTASAKLADPPADVGTEVQASWTPLGPTPVLGGGQATNSGRVDSLAMTGTGSSATIFSGSPGGGVWRSTDGGQTWTNMTDSLTFPDMSTGIAVGALAIDPTNPDVVYAGIGDPIGGTDGGAEGILKSTDDGSSWTLIPCYVGKTICGDFYAIDVDPNAPSHIFAATTGGFLLSTDGGNTWATPTGSDAGEVTAIAWTRRQIPPASSMPR